jgi:D-xylose transport system substrate-binding protein
MENCLTSTNNEIDAVLSENDGMAGGVISALADQGLDGTVLVTGQDGDLPALNRVALGTQLVSVLKDARNLGAAAGSAAAALAGGAAATDVEGTVQFTTPGGNDLTSIFLEPTPITQDNLQAVIDGGFASIEELCQGVEAGTVAVCDGGAMAEGSPEASPAS